MARDTRGPEKMVVAALQHLDGVTVTVENGRLYATVRPGSVAGWREQLRETLRAQVSDASAREMMFLVTWRTR